MRNRLTGLGLVLSLLLGACAAPPAGGPATAAPSRLSAQGQLSIRNADPSVIRVGSTYISVESNADRTIDVRAASSLDGLAGAAPSQVFANPANWPEVWAPEIVRDGGRYYIYFTAGAGSAHRMYVISSASATGGYGSAQALGLPDNKWAIDGAPFMYNNQRYFVWSGWAGDSNVEQNLYIAKMTGPAAVTGGRFLISQPRESWERQVGNPYINEGPEPIKDPSGQLHVVYSANGSWSDRYCLGELRLRAGGDPTSVWDWYKSNGCLFGAPGSQMMPGWDPTLYAKGVGHNSFVLQDGDIGTSPPAGSAFPMMYHGVPKANNPNPFWGGRYWYSGSFMWWGNTTYTRGPGNGPTSNTGYGLKFFE